MTELKITSRWAICVDKKYQSTPKPITIAIKTFFETINLLLPEILVFGNAGNRL
jgi:hypothetical protein